MTIRKKSDGLFILWKKLFLYQWHAGLSALLTHLIGPDAGLYLSDMSLVEHYHAQAALAYATANAERQLSVEQLLMEEQLLAFFLSFKFKLAEQALLVYADTHGTKLEAVSKHRIPYKDVSLSPALPFSAIVDQSS